MTKEERTKQIARRVTAFVLGTALTVSAIIIVPGKAKEPVEQKAYHSMQIKPGDTLYSIEEEYNNFSNRTSENYIDEICFINGISREDTIYAGNYLIVPVKYEP